MVTIRTERASDCEAIRAVHVSSFPTAAEACIVDTLRSAGQLAVSLLAEVEGRIVGHVAFSPVTVAGASHALGLAPLAVVPEYRRQGIGGILVTEGLAACERIGAGFVVVLGDPAYYRRFGFAPAAGWGLFDEYGGGDAFQAVELRAGAIPRGAGLLRYAPIFSPAGEVAVGEEGRRPTV